VVLINRWTRSRFSPGAVRREPPTFTIRPNRSISELRFTLTETPKKGSLSIDSTVFVPGVKYSCIVNQSIWSDRQGWWIVGWGMGRNLQRFRSGLVLKAHRRSYHSTLGLRVKMKEEVWGVPRPGRRSRRRSTSTSPAPVCRSHPLYYTNMQTVNRVRKSSKSTAVTEE